MKRKVICREFRELEGNYPGWKLLGRQMRAQHRGKHREAVRPQLLHTSKQGCWEGLSLFTVFTTFKAEVTKVLAPGRSRLVQLCMCPARREDHTPLQHYLLLLRAQVMVEQCPDATTDRGRPSPSSIPNTGLWNVWASITSLYSRYQPTLTLPRSQGLERRELPNVLKGLCDSIWSFVLCPMNNMLCPPKADVYKHFLHARSQYCLMPNTVG